MKYLALRQRLITLVQWYWGRDTEPLKAMLALYSIVYGIAYIALEYFTSAPSGTWLFVTTQLGPYTIGIMFILQALLLNIELEGKQLQRIYAIVTNYTLVFIWTADGLSTLNMMNKDGAIAPIIAFFMLPILGSSVLALRAFFEFIGNHDRN